ncbi:carboxypeptidase regulatory-like domain-containing protein [Planctomycetota bacterium]|nr:carboxypeptidase regulatory-like domain-containing protein [Planctomycetota bacterium]
MSVVNAEDLVCPGFAMDTKTREAVKELKIEYVVKKFDKGKEFDPNWDKARVATLSLEGNGKKFAVTLRGIENGSHTAVRAVAKGYDPSKPYVFVGRRYPKSLLFRMQKEKSRSFKPDKRKTRVVRGVEEWMIKGKIFDAETGEPVKRVKIESSMHDDYGLPSWFSKKEMKFTFNDQTGKYVVKVRPSIWNDRDVFFRFQADGYQTVFYKLDLKRGVMTRDVELRPIGDLGPVNYMLGRDYVPAAQTMATQDGITDDGKNPFGDAGEEVNPFGDSGAKIQESKKPKRSSSSRGPRRSWIGPDSRLASEVRSYDDPEEIGNDVPDFGESDFPGKPDMPSDIRHELQRAKTLLEQEGGGETTRHSASRARQTNRRPSNIKTPHKIRSMDQDKTYVVKLLVKDSVTGKMLDDYEVDVYENGPKELDNVRQYRGLEQLGNVNTQMTPTNDGGFVHIFEEFMARDYKRYIIIKDGYKPFTSEWVDSEEKINLVEGQLEVFDKFAGRVVDADGEPLANARVILFDDKKESSVSIEDGIVRVASDFEDYEEYITDNNGHFDTGKIDHSFQMMVVHDTGLMVMSYRDAADGRDEFTVEPWIACVVDLSGLENIYSNHRIASKFEINRSGSKRFVGMHDEKLQGIKFKVEELVGNDDALRFLPNLTHRYNFYADMDQYDDLLAEVWIGNLEIKSSLQLGETIPVKQRGVLVSGQVICPDGNFDSSWTVVEAIMVYRFDPEEYLNKNMPGNAHVFEVFGHSWKANRDGHDYLRTDAGRKLFEKMLEKNRFEPPHMLKFMKNGEFRAYGCGEGNYSIGIRMKNRKGITYSYSKDFSISSGKRNGEHRLGTINLKQGAQQHRK